MLRPLARVRKRQSGQPIAREIRVLSLAPAKVRPFGCVKATDGRAAAVSACEKASEWFVDGLEWRAGSSQAAISACEKALDLRTEYKQSSRSDGGFGVAAISACDVASEGSGDCMQSSQLEADSSHVAANSARGKAPGGTRDGQQCMQARTVKRVQWAVGNANRCEHVGLGVDAVSSTSTRGSTARRPRLCGQWARLVKEEIDILVPRYETLPEWSLVVKLLEPKLRAHYQHAEVPLTTMLLQWELWSEEPAPLIQRMGQFVLTYLLVNIAIAGDS